RRARAAGTGLASPSGMCKLACPAQPTWNGIKMTDSRARSVDHGAARKDNAPPEPSLPEAGVARTYDRMAPLYDTVFGRVLEPGRRRMAQCIRTLQPASLLEVGVGTGLALAGYPPECRIVGIDLSHDML